MESTKIPENEDFEQYYINTCNKLKKAFKEFEEVIIEHKVREKNDRLLEKIKKYRKLKMTNDEYAEPLKKLKESQKKYAEYLETYDALKIAYRKICLGKRPDISCKDLMMLKRTWKKMVDDFKLDIWLARKTKEFDELKNGVAEIIENYCENELLK